MDVHASSAPVLMAVQPSPVAPRLLAAYAIGATLWTPALVLVAGRFESALARVLPSLSFADAAQLFAAMWSLRFVLYIAGAYRRWDYGYGVNGVIVSPRFTLAEKAQRIACDWFGLLLAALWICLMVAAIVSAVAGR